MFTAILALLCQIFFGNPVPDRIDRYLTAQQFQGTVLAAKGEKILFCKGYGFANVEHQVPNTPDTVFRIGSLTKQFTAAAILLLQEQGRLNVHDPVSRYLPDFPHSEITLHHLLTHTSGLAEITDFPNLREIQRQPSSAAKVMGYFQNLPLQFPPGTRCAYCNSGYIVLGAVIEAVTGQSYAAYLQNLFTPLHLEATFYESETIIPHRASGYILKDEILSHAPFIDMSFPHAAGGLASNVYDLYAWTLALHHNPKFAIMTKEHAADDQKKATYGYGLRIGSQPVVSHFGSIEGFRSALFYYPEAEMTLIILSNVENTDVRRLQETLSSFLLDITSTSWRCALPCSACDWLTSCTRWNISSFNAQGIDVSLILLGTWR